MVSFDLLTMVSFDLHPQLPERQYVWTALSARAKAKGWTDIEQLLTAKVSLETQSCLDLWPFPDVFCILYTLLSQW